MLGKIFFVSTLPVSLPAVGAADALLEVAYHKKPLRGLAIAAATAFSSLTLNHYVANPQATLSDSARFTLSGPANKNFSKTAFDDFGRASAKWIIVPVMALAAGTGGALDGAEEGVKMGVELDKKMTKSSEGILRP